MYRNFMVKQIKTKADFNRITKVLKENKMAYTMHTQGKLQDKQFAEREGKFYILEPLHCKDTAVELKTIISDGLMLWVMVGNYKYGSTRRYDICKELGFKLEGEA